MFERFAKDARAAVMLAEEEARTGRRSAIGTEHILIALAAGGADSAARALRDSGLTAAVLRSGIRRMDGDDLDPAALALVGIDLEKVRRATEERFGAGALDPAPTGRAPRGHLPFSAGAKHALELALRSAVVLRTGSISTGHLLIGVIDEGRDRGAAALRACGADLVGLRAATVELLASEAA